MAKKNGREILMSVIDVIEEKGISAREACNELGILHSSFFNQLKKASQDDQYAYTRATELRADKIFEEILDIADDSDSDNETRITEDGVEMVKGNPENVQRSRLRVDARKWMLSKMMPKKYGDKIDVTTDGEKMPSPQIILNKNE